MSLAAAGAGLAGARAASFSVLGVAGETTLALSSCDIERELSISWGVSPNGTASI